MAKLPNPLRVFYDHRKRDSLATAKVMRLPPELVEQISEYLDRRTICSLRSTSRYMAQCTFRRFKRLFYAVATDLSRKSLTKLLELARDRDITPMVHQMTICKGKRHGYGEGYCWEQRAPHFDFAQQEGFTSFRALLQALVNCRSFRIYGRGFVLTRWRPARSLSPLGVLGILMRLMVMDDLRVRFLKLDVWVHDVLRPGDGGAVDKMSTLISLYPALATAFSRLEGLYLQHAQFASLDSLRTFMDVLRSSRLKRLDISFPRKPVEHQSFMHALASVRNSLHLSEFSISHGYLSHSSNAIKDFLHSQRRSLCKLMLFRLGLYGDDDGWISILESLRDTKHSSLQEIYLGYLSETEAVLTPTGLEGITRFVFFPSVANIVVVGPSGAVVPSNIEALVKRPPGQSLTFRHCGPKMDVALQRLVDWTVLRRFRIVRTT
ncbi:hypothetical protein BDV18DRAFT_161069 [Aspergillus unguis]